MLLLNYSTDFRIDGGSTLSIIQVEDLKKDYGNNKGVFNVSFAIEAGEVFGFLGPNGAGKTTTIRHLLGFLNADHGKCEIMGYDCRTQQELLQKDVSYLSGELSFFEEMTGIGFLKFIAKIKGVKDLTLMNELIQYFEFDPKVRLKRMSKGMKQKIGLVAAFMADSAVLILDEPTSGLDPLMQSKFIQLIQKEKTKGKTILMSSHNFEEVEKTCDRVAIIKEGKLVALESIDELKLKRRKIYRLSFELKADYQRFTKENFEITTFSDQHIDVAVEGSVKPLISALSNYSVNGLEIVNQGLEDIFMGYYGGQK